MCLGVGDVGEIERLYGLIIYKNFLLIISDLSKVQAL